MNSTNHLDICHGLVEDLCALVQSREGFYANKPKHSLEELTALLQDAYANAEGYSLMLCEIALMLAECAEYRPNHARSLAHAVGWMRSEDQLAGLLEDPVLLDTYIEKYGPDRLVFTYYKHLAYACHAVRNAALRTFVEENTLPERVRGLYEITPEMLMDDEEAAHQQLAGRLLRMGGIPSELSREWLIGIDVGAISEAFGIHGENEKAVFASLGEDRVENLELLAEAVQALFGEGGP
jgi:hypothetical protein